MMKKTYLLFFLVLSACILFAASAEETVFLEQVPIAAFCGYDMHDLAGLELVCYWNDCESGVSEAEPGITAEQLLALSVTGKANDLSVTGNTTIYRLVDINGETAAVFEFYGDLLVLPDGMYAVTE